MNKKDIVFIDSTFKLIGGFLATPRGNQELINIRINERGEYEKIDPDTPSVITTNYD